LCSVRTAFLFILSELCLLCPLNPLSIDLGDGVDEGCDWRDERGGRPIAVCVCARVRARAAADRVRVAAAAPVATLRDNNTLDSFFLRCFSSNQIASNSSRDSDECDACDTSQQPLLLELPELFPDADDDVAL
jgi:hypothetical protein